MVLLIAGPLAWERQTAEGLRTAAAAVEGLPPELTILFGVSSRAITDFAPMQAASTRPEEPRASDTEFRPHASGCDVLSVVRAQVCDDGAENPDLMGQPNGHRPLAASAS